MKEYTKVIIHIPHSSITVPYEYLQQFLINNEELKLELLTMTDMYANEIFNLRYNKVVFPISRLVCDVERFRDEDKEIMSKKGMWVCYTKTSHLKDLKIVNEKQKKEILHKYYDIHHKELTDNVDNSLMRYNRCLVIDAHSFPSKPLPYEHNQSGERPDICIGTDEFHTPDWLIEICKKHFIKYGYSVKINYPFSGCMIPIKYYHNSKDVLGIMIEINRKSYMDESNGEKTINFIHIKQCVSELVDYINGLL